MRWGWRCPVAPVILLAACLTTTDSHAEETWSWAKLVDELHYQDPPEPDWAAVLNEKIAKGLPLPDPTAESRVLSDKAAPDLQFHYWSSEWPWKKGWNPSPEARRKVLLAARKYPTSIYEVLDALPTDEAALNEVAEILRGLPGAEDYQEKTRRKVRAWLFRHDGRMRDQVLEDCLRPDWGALDRGKPDPSLDILMAREPEAAERILKNLAVDADPRRRVLAAGLLEIRAGPADREEWRRKLIEIAEDPKLSNDAREWAVEFLAKQDWREKNDWVVSRLRSPDCGKTYWFYPYVENNPEIWIPILAKITAGDDRVARNHAMQLLIGPDFEGKVAEDALRPLLPWIADPSWADDPEWRTNFFTVLNWGDMPDSIEPLIARLPEETNSECIRLGALILARHQVKRAVPAMKEALKRCEGQEDLTDVVRSIRRLEEFPQQEIVDGLVAYFTSNPTDDQQDEFRRGVAKSCTPSEAIGGVYAEEFPDNPELVESILRRTTEEHSKNPDLAGNLRHCVMLGAPAHAAALVADGIAGKSIQPDELAAALIHCRDQAWDARAFDKLRGKTGEAGAIAAVLGGDRKRMDGLLAGKDQRALTALLEAARFAREPFDIQRVARFLESENDGLSGAAWYYLRERGEPEAVGICESHLASEDPESLTFWNPKQGRFGRAGRIAETLKQRFGFKGVPREILSLESYSTGSSSDAWHIVISSENSFAVHDFGGSRLGVGRLEAESVERVRKFLTTYQVDGLPSLRQPSICDGVTYNFIHATAEGINGMGIENPSTARPDLSPSVNMGGSRSYSKGIVIYGYLVDLITNTVESADLKLQYDRGTEIVVPKETQEAVTVWNRGKDLRILTGEGAGLRWLAVDGDTRLIKGPADEPDECPILREFNDSSAIPKPPYPEYRKSYARAGDGFLYHGRLDETVGVWLFRKGKPFELVAKGRFWGVNASSDGAWAVASQAPEGQERSTPNGVVRINLSSRQLMPVALKPADHFDVVAFLPTKGRFLLGRSQDSSAKTPTGPKSREYYLLDAATGALDRVKGDFEGLNDPQLRPFQKAGKPGCVWMARSSTNWTPGHIGGETQIGIYDLNTFKFQKVRDAEGIRFESMQMWVDEGENLIHAVVDGDLVRLKLR